MQKKVLKMVYVGEHNLNSVNTPEGTVTGGKLEGIFKVTNSTESYMLMVIMVSLLVLFYKK